MKQSNQRLNLILTLTATLILTACGGSSLPSELSAGSTAAAVQPAQVIPVFGYATPASIQVGTTSLVTGQYGASTKYTYVLTNPSIGTLTGNSFVAGSSAGQAVINVIDSAGTVYPVTIDVTAAPPPPAPVLPGTKALYRFQYFDGFGVQHRVIQDANVNPGGYNEEGVAFNVIRDSNVAGTVALRECKDMTFNQSIFQSSDANCEGQTFVRILGYVYTSPGAGLQAVKRYSIEYMTNLGLLTDRIPFLDNNPGPNTYRWDSNNVYYVPTQSAP